MGRSQVAFILHRLIRHMHVDADCEMFVQLLCESCAKCIPVSLKYSSVHSNGNAKQYCLIIRDHRDHSGA